MMKLDFIFILIFITFSGKIYGQYVTIIGSPYIQDEPNHKLILLAHKPDSGSSVKFTLGGKDEIKKLNNNEFNVVELMYPEDKSLANEINITTAIKNKCSLQSIKLIDTKKSPVIFIQLDKPIYKTGDVFAFRIFILNQNLRPSSGDVPVDVSIIDSKSHVIQKYSKINKVPSKFGVYENSVKIADSPNLGKWKIQVTAASRDITKTFDVQKPTEENLEVYLEIAPLVAFVDKRVYITIWVKDNTDKFFTGTAKLSVTAKFKGSEKIEIDELLRTELVEGNRKGIVVDFADDLGLRYPTSDMLLKFTVEVTDKISKRSTTVWREIEMRHAGKNIIQVVRKEYFKPGFKFPTKVKVKVLDGRPDNSFNQLSITNEYYGKNKATGKPAKQQKSIKVNLKNGEAVNILQTKAEMDKIVVRLEFGGVELVETILPLPTFKANEYMQVTMLNKSTNVNDKILLSAHTTGEMETLHVVVFGLNGIIHVDEFPEAEGKDVHQFTLELTESMKPEARIFVFYVHEKTGVLVYDELSISLGFSIDNSLEISSEKSLKPRETANINFQTQEGSKVFLSATDQNPPTINRDNEISRGEIYNELVYYLNLKFKNSSIFHFEKLNSFVLHTARSGAPCDSEMANVLSQDLNEDGTEVDQNPIKYFPDIWSDKSYVAKTDQMQSVDLKVPDSLVSWRFFAISVHPEKGFTVAKVQPRMTIKNDISVQLKTPQSAYKDEVLWIEYSIFNSLSEDLNAEVHVSVENGLLMNKYERQEFNILCLDFKQSQKKDKSIRLKVPSEKSSSVDTFLVQPDGNGDLSITLVAVAGSYNDEVTKVIKIGSKKVKSLISSSLLDANGRRQYGEYNEDVLVTVYGNLLGPALDGLENLFKSPLKIDEEKILKFAAAITSFKFLELTNEPSQEKDNKMKKLMSDMTVGYQEALAILDNYSQQQDNCNSTWLAALTVQALFNAQKFIEIDPNVINKSLKFIESQQNDDGGFIYNEQCDYRREMSTSDRDLVTTAEILVAFVKDSNTKEQFKAEIGSSIRFLKSASLNNDYPKILVAYTLALNGDINDAKRLLNGMDNKFMSPNNSKLYAEFSEIAAYKILTQILVNSNPQDEVKWLLERRDVNGGFYSPYSTALSLRALYEYSKYKNLQSVNLKISSSQIGKSISNPIDFEVIELKQNQMLRTDGDGTGYVQIYKEIIQEPKNTSDYFIINAFRTDEGTDDLKLDITLSLNGSKAIENLLVVEVELPRGFKLSSYNLKDNLLNVDVRNDRNLVVFYLSRLDKEQTITIKAAKVFEFSNHKTSVIKVYDYYRTNIMDSIHYVHDRREENCERIRVIKEIKKAEDAQAVTREAEKLTEEAKDAVSSASSAISDADRRRKNADQSIQSAQSQISKAQDEAANANQIVAEAVRIAEDAEKVKEARTPVTYPEEQEVEEHVEYPECFADQRRRTRGIDEQEESEAIRTQDDADNKDKILERAKCVELKAKSNTKDAKDEADRKQQDADNARQKASKALDEVKNTKGQAEDLRREVMNKQYQISQAQQNVNEGRTKVNRAKSAIESTQTENDQASEAVTATQRKVQNAIKETKNALTLAQNAYKAVEAQDTVTSASTLAAEIKSDAERTRNDAQNARSKSSNVLSSTTKVELEGKQTKDAVDQIHQQTEDIKSRAEESESKAKLAEEKYRAAIKLTEALQEQADEAQNKYQEAFKKEKSKVRERLQAEKEARKVRELANKAREAEVQKAIDYASKAEKDAKDAEKFAKEAFNILNNVKQTAKTAENDRAEALKILTTLKLLNQASANAEEASTNNQIKQTAIAASKAYQTAQVESQKARRAANNANNAANAAKQTNDAVVVVENLKTALEQTREAETAMKNTLEQKTNTVNAKNVCDEAKKVADELKKCSSAAFEMNSLINRFNKDIGKIKENSSSALMAIQTARTLFTDVLELDENQQVKVEQNNLNGLERHVNTATSNANAALTKANNAKQNIFESCKALRVATSSETATQESKNCEAEKKKIMKEEYKFSKEKTPLINMRTRANNILNAAEQRKLAVGTEIAKQSVDNANRYATETTNEAKTFTDTQKAIQDLMTGLEKAMKLTVEVKIPMREGRMESMDLVAVKELSVDKNVTEAIKDSEKAKKNAKKLSENMKFVKKSDLASQAASEAKQIEKNAVDAYQIASDARKSADEIKKAVDAAKKAYDKSQEVQKLYDQIIADKKSTEDDVKAAQKASEEALKLGATQNEIDEALKIRRGSNPLENLKFNFERVENDAKSSIEIALEARKQAFEAAKAALEAEDINAASKEVQKTDVAVKTVKDAQNSMELISKRAEQFRKLAEELKLATMRLKTETEDKMKSDQKRIIESLALNATLESTELQKLLNQTKDAKSSTENSLGLIFNAEQATINARSQVQTQGSLRMNNNLLEIAKKANEALKSAEAASERSMEAAKNVQQAAVDIKIETDLSSITALVKNAIEEQRMIIEAKQEVVKARYDAEDASRAALERVRIAQDAQKVAENYRISQEKKEAYKSSNSLSQAVQLAKTEAMKANQAHEECVNIAENLNQISIDIRNLLEAERAPEITQTILNAITTVNKATEDAQKIALSASQKLNEATNRELDAKQQINNWKDEVASAIQTALDIKSAESRVVQAKDKIIHYVEKADEVRELAKNAEQEAISAKAEAEKKKIKKELQKAQEEKNKIDTILNQADEEVSKAELASEEAEKALGNLQVEMGEDENPSEIMKNTQSEVQNAINGYKNAEENANEVKKIVEFYKNQELEATTVKDAKRLFQNLKQTVEDAGYKLEEVKKYSNEAQVAKDQVLRDVTEINGS